MPETRDDPSRQEDSDRDLVALLARREDELALHRARAEGGGVMQVLRSYRERAEVAEARLRIAEEDLARSKDAHNHDAVRAVQAEAKLAEAEATIQRVHDVAFAHWGDIKDKDGRTNLFIIGRVDMLDWVKAALDPASAATWGKSDDDTEDTCAHRAGQTGDDNGEVSDDHGNTWPRCSADCDIHVVRPGWVQCRCEPKEMPL